MYLIEQNKNIIIRRTLYLILINQQINKAKPHGIFSERHILKNRQQNNQLSSEETQHSPRKDNYTFRETNSGLG